MQQPRVGLQIKDERIITFRQPLEPQEALDLARLIGAAGNEEYRLVHIGVLEGGNQRDPIVAGVTLRFEKR